MARKKSLPTQAGTLTKAERKYCVTRKELLAVVVFLKYFRHYLYKHKCVVRTDHSALRWLLETKNPEGQVARWIQVISSQDIEIRHRPGKQHANADALSRIPCRQCGYQPKILDKVNTVNANGSNHVKQEETLGDLQDKDPDIMLIKTWIKEGKRPSFVKVKGQSRRKPGMFFGVSGLGKLRERLEEAHRQTRAFTKQSVQRQKRYHDSKLQWDKFEQGDMVYVYFPMRKVGKSPKLMSFWKGPYTIVSKLSEVTYKVRRGDGKILGSPSRNAKHQGYKEETWHGLSTVLRKVWNTGGLGKLI
ncbi:uncharacterized protein [Argopecten irradians]|uniref:uncharacterized protein n=1 Tax=Argopecten irradians TaxID=31199 RepID=UPI00370F8A8F